MIALIVQQQEGKYNIVNSEATEAYLAKPKTYYNYESFDKAIEAARVFTDGTGLLVYDKYQSAEVNINSGKIVLQLFGWTKNFPKVKSGRKPGGTKKCSIKFEWSGNDCIVNIDIEPKNIKHYKFEVIPSRKCMELLIELGIKTTLNNKKYDNQDIIDHWSKDRIETVYPKDRLNMKINKLKAELERLERIKNG